MSEVAATSTLTVDDARRLTERIRYTALSVRDGMEKLQRLVQEAKDGSAHVALGFASWTAYLSQTLGSEPLRLARDDRQALVGYLAGEGMSTRAIAPIVGASRMTVQRDLEPTVTNVTVERPATVTSLDGRQRPSSQPPRVNTTTGEITDDYADLDTDETTFESALASARSDDNLSRENVAAHIAKADRTPPRRPLVDVARDAGQDLRKAAERLERIATDDRFARNKNEVAAHLRHHLAYAIQVCQDLDRSIN